MYLFLHGHGAGSYGYGSSFLSVTDVHTYASSVVTAGTSMGLARNYLAACSSSPGGF